LNDGDVCNLGALNLERFVNEAHELDLSELMRVTDLMVRMLDAVIDLSHFSSEKVNKTSRDNRRIGLGFMGLGDCLAAMRVPYNSAEGRKMARAICDAMQAQAHTTSAELAELKGCFPNYELSVYAEGVQSVARCVPEGMPKSLKRRNAALTNVAPTGTTSLMFGVTNGIEPQFSTAFFYKGVLDQKTAIQCGWTELFKALSEEYMVGDALFKFLSEGNVPSEHKHIPAHVAAMCEAAGAPFLEATEEDVRIAYTNEFTELIMRISRSGSIQDMKDIPRRIRDVFVVAGDISPEDHTLMQATAQEVFCNAISKTINLPEHATLKDVYVAYMMAYQKGLKGCTVYRDNSRVFQPLNQGVQDELFPGETAEEYDIDLSDGDCPAASSSSSTPDVSSGSDNEDELRSSSSDDIRERAGYTRCPECKERALQHASGCDQCMSCSYSACATPLRRSTAALHVK